MNVRMHIFIIDLDFDRDLIDSILHTFNFLVFCSVLPRMLRGSLSGVVRVKNSV
jgi:hypothetical protein